jgi:Ni,Fe-hydrogenase III large subunit/Ni,Fe-hydrogenase III component G
MNLTVDLLQQLKTEWADGILSADHVGGDVIEIAATPSNAAKIADWLVRNHDLRIGAMTVRDQGARWSVHYHFYSHAADGPWVVLTAAISADRPEIPSLSATIHSVDWLEREVEDHFGLRFTGHPRLGDFVFHDEEWQEGLAPMRENFEVRARIRTQKPKLDWRPRRILHTQGAFSMTIGPIYGGISEPVHFLLESVGEEVVRANPRLFYKYRAIEKLAEGQKPDSAILLAERFDAIHAFAHSLASCQAFERLNDVQVPPRAQGLRVILAELERLRSHVGAIRGICGSTGLSVAESQAAILEEEALRLCGSIAGHRYLFGLNAIGGLAVDISDAACRALMESLSDLKSGLTTLRDMLADSSSFLDRLEEVGVIDTRQAFEHGLVGPVARASHYLCDLRLVHPYGGYDAYTFEQAGEGEGDGYARLRVLFFEAFQSIEISRQAIDRLPDGSVMAGGGREPRRDGGGAAFGWVEAPGGAAFHAVWLNGRGEIERYRIVPPSFFNWHGFHLAVEGFAFQDFPIILATFALSVAENDR